MKAPQSYQDAQDELKDILEYLQNPAANIDELAAKVSRAKELIDWSREKLRNTEKEIGTLLDGLN